MLFYFSVSLTFWRDRAVKDVINKFGGSKSIIKLSSNNLMCNYSGSKNCPNDGVFYLACCYINSNSNYITLGLF